MGVTVKHRSRVARDPSQPNLRQVHLIHAELHDELRASGFSVHAGRWGRISRRGASTCCACRWAHGCTWARRQSLKSRACATPVPSSSACKGLLAAVLDHDAQGHLIRKAGIMGIVLSDGEVRRPIPYAWSCRRSRTSR